MAHPLYGHALRLVGKPVYVHHVSGRTYHGLLHSTTPKGVYLLPFQSQGRLMSGLSSDNILEHIGNVEFEKTAKMDLVYSPALYFGFGALTGLTAAALFW